MNHKWKYVSSNLIVSIWLKSQNFCNKKLRAYVSHHYNVSLNSILHLKKHWKGKIWERIFSSIILEKLIDWRQSHSWEKISVFFFCHKSTVTQHISIESFNCIANLISYSFEHNIRKRNLIHAQCREILVNALFQFHYLMLVPYAARIVCLCTRLL